MVETKDFNKGGLNTDVEENLLSPSDWVDALNIHVGSPDAQVESIISDIRGNRNIMSSYVLPNGINKIIGVFGNQTRNRVYCFMWNSNDFHRIFYIDIEKETVTDIFKNIDWTSSVDVLRFKAENRITGINIIVRAEEEGDLLEWVDRGNPPRKINVLKGALHGLAGGYPAVMIEDYISVAKKIPDIPQNVIYNNVVSNQINNLRRKLFQFRYRWVYDDLEKSPWGGWSDLPLPINALAVATDTDPTKNCTISMLVTTGNALVTDIEISVRQNINSLWGDAYLFETLNKSDLGLADNAFYSYVFTNNNAGTIIPANEASLLFSNVPLIAETQELVNGNTLLYGNTTEGFDTPEQMNVTLVAVNHITTLNNGDSINAWKWSGKYRLGIVYYDDQGRTDGVHTYVNNTNNDCVVNIPDYLDDGTAPPSTSYQIQTATVTMTIRHQPPLWAKRYRVVRSQCLTYDRFAYYVTLAKFADTNFYYYCLDDINGSMITNGQNAIVYDYIQGDRIRVVRKMDVTAFPSFPILPNLDVEISAKVKDPFISGVQRMGTFLKVKFPPASTIELNVSYLVELYTPSTLPLKIQFYEFAPIWEVLNPGTVNRAHQGTVNQDIPTNTAAQLVYGPAYGDVYAKRYFNMDTVNSAGAITPYTNVPLLDPNFNEAYLSAVNSNGRFLVEDPNSGRRNYPNLVRFGGQYLQGTNINQTNIFYPEDFDEYDRTYGAIRRLKTRDRDIRIFQEYKIGRVPVYQQVIKDAAGNDVLAQSDKLINNIQYYVGDYGIGNAPDSLASDNFADYYCDTNRGAVIRISNDGNTPISIIYFNNKYYAAKLPLYNKRTDVSYTPPHYTGDKPGDAPVLGVFNALHNEYIVAFTESATYVAGIPTPTRTVFSTAATRSFDEKENRFVCPLSYEPEAMVNVGTKLITFKNGVGFIHDSTTYCNFYGTQFDASVTLVFNSKPNLKKTFISLDEYSDNVWVADAITTSNGQSSSLIAGDFENFEGHQYASFLGDTTGSNGVINGDSLKGGWIKIKLVKKAASELVKLVTVAVKSIMSNENLH